MFWGNYIGCQFDAGWTSSWTSWCSSHCMGQLRRTCHMSNRCQSPTSVIWQIHVCRTTDQNTAGWQVVRYCQCCFRLWGGTCYLFQRRYVWLMTLRPVIQKSNSSISMTGVKVTAAKTRCGLPRLQANHKGWSRSCRWGPRSSSMLALLKARCSDNYLSLRYALRWVAKIVFAGVP